MRVGVPDAGELLQSYVGDGEYLEKIHPGRPTRLLGVQSRRKFGDTDLDVAPDTERRRAETLYMETTKPTQ